MSNHWATAWDKEILPVIKGRRLMIACGFDGVIAPPSEATPDIELYEKIKVLLRKLSLCDGVSLVVVSSRELADLRARIALGDMAYCANSGMQIETPDLKWESDEAVSFRKNLSILVNQMRNAFLEIPGVRIDDRYLSVSVDWRAVPEQHRRTLNTFVEEFGHQSTELILERGFLEWVFRPRLAVNSGAAVRFLLERSSLEPHQILVLGTEEGDQSVFECFKDGVTINVGDEPSSQARFRASNASDVSGLLFCLYVARGGKSKTSAVNCSRSVLCV